MSEGNYSYKFCPKCGARANSDSAFCVKCGAPLRPSNTETKTSAQGSGQAAASQSAAKPQQKKGSAKGAIVMIALAALVVWALFSGSTQHYKDYPSAGAHVLPQMLKHDETLYVSMSTADYNPFLGGQSLADKILTEAERYSGKAAEGERLGLLCWPTQVETYQTGKKGDVYDLNLKIHMQYFLTEAQDKELAASVQSILSGLRLDGLSDYEKVRAIYNYICAHVTYDYDRLEDDSDVLKYTAYAAVKRGTAVCSGVADLFYYLANSAGVETHIKTNTIHAWNFVKLGGKYYYLDATWDLGKNEANYDYFLKGSVDFQHYGGILIGLHGAGNLLTNTDKGYDFSHYEYGSPLNDR